MMMYTLEDTAGQTAVIKVIGVGGGGGNALNNMIVQQLSGVDFVIANTDAQAIAQSHAQIKMQLGANVTRGLGAGANPQIGRQAAEEERDQIREILSETDMVFITAGMGGGTGTGAAPVIAEVAHELGVLTVAVVTKPFDFEGKRRMRQAEMGIAELRKHVDTLITIPNQKLIEAVGMNTTMLEAFRKVDDVLLEAVRGIAELITRPGYINVDFADVRSIMTETQGMAVMGAASASGDGRALEAATRAISSPLLEDVDIQGARGLLVNITGAEDLTLAEYNEAVGMIQDVTDDDANVICGMVYDESLGEEVRVTVVATGLTCEADARLYSLGSGRRGVPVSNNSYNRQPPPVAKTSLSSERSRNERSPFTGRDAFSSTTQHRDSKKTAPRSNNGARPPHDDRFNSNQNHRNRNDRNRSNNNSKTKNHDLSNKMKSDNNSRFNEAELDIPTWLRDQSE
ncbi:MAG: cell division protein FtsZ [Mariprofundales bacterium]